MDKVSSRQFLKIISLLCLLVIESISLLHADQIELSKEEQEFLREHPVLSVAIGTSFPPYQYVEQVAGKAAFKGIVSDYLIALENKLGITLQPVFGITFRKALQLGKEKEIDLFAAVSDTVERRQFLRFTSPYLVSPLVIITRQDSPFIGSVGDLNHKKIAIIKHLANYSKITNDYSDLDVQFVYRENVTEVLRAVSSGLADACISNLSVAYYLIHKHGFDNLKVAAPTNWRDNKLSMGIRNDWPILVGIIDKALASISDKQKIEIHEKWVPFYYEPVYSPWTIKNIFIPFLVMLIGALVIVFLWNLKLKGSLVTKNKEEIKLVYMSTHDPLTDLLNRKELFSLLSHDIKACQRYQRPLSVMMIDIDGFKEINDNLGHSAGDKVLTELSRELKASCRNTDYVGRYGGEEFTMVLPQTPLVAGREFAERLRSRIENHCFMDNQGQKIEVTISIGISHYSDNCQTIDDIIETADQALYEAKQTGKNRVICGSMG